MTCKKEHTGSESDPSVGSSTFDIPRLVSDRDGDEVDMKSSTTGSRDRFVCVLSAYKGIVDNKIHGG